MNISKAKSLVEGQEDPAASSASSAVAVPGREKASHSKKKLCHIAGCPRITVREGLCYRHHQNPNAKVAADNFDESYERLTEFKRKNGHCRVTPSKHDKDLAEFVQRTRKCYATLKKNGVKKSKVLPPERIEKLNELGFEWKPSEIPVAAETPTSPSTESTSASAKKRCRIPGCPMQETKSGLCHRHFKDPDASNKVRKSWDKLYESLVQFQHQHGHCRVTEKDDKDISNFVAKNRRCLERSKKGVNVNFLTPERIEKLNDVGFEWKIWTTEDWEQRYEELQEFKRQHGNFTVRRSENPQLCLWIQTQRAGYKNFERQFHAKQQKKANARAAAFRGGTGVDTGSNQQGQDINQESSENTKNKPYIISPERIVNLQMIGFEFKVSETTWDESWEKHYVGLLKFKSEFGHCRVSRNYADNISLGLWVKAQRKNYKLRQEGKVLPTLTEDRIRRLNGIGFEWRLK
jgi:hypothetical protein